MGDKINISTIFANIVTFSPNFVTFFPTLSLFYFPNFPRKQISIRKKCRSVNLSLNLLNLFVNLPKFIVCIIKVAECQLSEGINLHPRNIIISGDIIPLPRCTSELICISRENTQWSKCNIIIISLDR